MTIKPANSSWDRDDSSDSSRRSTPAMPLPPPAHQRASSSVSQSHQSDPSPVDLSAPLDLSEVQDFSITKKPQSSISQSKGKLDDTLSKLMKRKNVVCICRFLLPIKVVINI